MHVVLGSIVLLIMAMAVWARWGDSLLTLLLLTVIALVGAAAALIGKVLYDKFREKEGAEDAQDRRHEETLRLYNLAIRDYPPAADIVRIVGEKVEAGLRSAGLPRPYKDGLDRMVDAIRHIYDQSIPDRSSLHNLDIDDFNVRDQLQPFVKFAEKFDADKIADAFAACYLALQRAMPKTEGQFLIPITSLVNVPQLVTDMCMPFAKMHGDIPTTAWRHWHAGAIRAAAEQKSKELVYPSQYKGDPEKLPELYLHPMLQPLLWAKVPWGIPDETRYMHHRCLGAPGSGKTTFLSHFILNDLPKVVRGEASLVVLDSQRLVRQLSHTRMFNRDGLIIIDPNKDYPLALNPFQMKSGDAERDLNAKVDVLSYAFGGMTEQGSTDLQKGAMGYIISAAAHVPNANLDTLLEFFRPQKKGFLFPFPEIWGRLDPSTQYYFEHVFPNVAVNTKTGILQRIMYLRRVGAIERMLNASECRLDFFEQFQQGGKVVLIDTDQDALSPENREIFGRIFIAMLDQVATRRAKYDEKSLKPVFVIIDEAHDYIEYDERFAAMLVKARNKRIALTVAHHNKGQIRNEKTRNSLEEVAIRSRCPERGHPVEIDLGRVDAPKTFRVPIDPLNWASDYPQLSAAEYAAMRKRIFDKFGATNVPRPAPNIPLAQFTEE